MLRCNRCAYRNSLCFGFITYALKNKRISSLAEFQLKFAINIGSRAVRKFFNKHCWKRNGFPGTIGDNTFKNLRGNGYSKNKT